jgi:hypothetical protein
LRRRAAGKPVFIFYNIREYALTYSGICAIIIVSKDKYRGKEKKGIEQKETKEKR